MPPARLRCAALFLAACALLPLARAQRPSSEVPQGGGACSTDWDCSLGGTCDARKCACDAWFTGPRCALLNLQAPKDDQQGLCHHGFDSYYSWGGRALPQVAKRKPAAGGAPGQVAAAVTEYHLYASFMCDHNTLHKWTTVSSSGHFVSDSAVGPFRFSPEQCEDDICTPMVVPWSHNTVANYNASAAASGAPDVWQVWHIGDGVVNASLFSPCFNQSAVGARVDVVAGAATEIEDNLRAVPPVSPVSPGNEVFISYAATPSGPWTRAQANKPLRIEFDAGGAWPQGATNPSPLQMPDGSVNMYFTNADEENPCGLVSNCIGVATSTNGWEGPFVPHPHHLTNLESEDAHVFRDTRGNYHMLTNVNTCHKRCPIGVECGGHSWSRDGITFSNLTVGAFGPYITFADGTGWNNSYAERPLVLQNDDGSPHAFYVGLGRTTYTDSCNWPMLFCTGAPGEKCGPTVRPRSAAGDAVRRQDL